MGLLFAPLATAPTFTWAAKPSAANNSGKVIRVSDIGPDGSFWTSNGTRWVALNGHALLAHDAVARGIAPSGTIGTGTSGQLTLGTALARTYSEGLWLYLPAIATTPAITAGLYYCVMSSTTVGTIYSNGPGSAALNITAGTTYTGSTSEQTLYSLTLPANAMGVSGSLELKSIWSQNNNANAKSASSRLGGTLIMSQNVASTASLQSYIILRNRNAANVQTAYASSNSAFATATTANNAYTIDTSVDSTFLIAGLLTTATDYLIMEGFDACLLT